MPFNRTGLIRQASDHLAIPPDCDCSGCASYRYAVRMNHPRHAAVFADQARAFHGLTPTPLDSIDVNTAYGSIRRPVPEWPKYLPDGTPWTDEPARTTGLQPPEKRYYSYIPSYLYRGQGPAHFGMEVEISCSDIYPVMEAVQGHLGNLAYFKDDGSVAGIEIVTHPFDYPWAEKNFDWDVFPAIRDAGGRAITSSNGIHIHVSRKAFDTDSHLYRWMKLFYRNANDIHRIARRADNHWCSFTSTHRQGHMAHVRKEKMGRPKPMPDNWMYDGYGVIYVLDMSAPISHDRYGFDPYEVVDRNSSLPHYAAQWHRPSRAWYRCVDAFETIDRRYDPYRPARDTTLDCGRYSAINTTNDATLEVRVFASTVRAERARAALQLCAASVEYTRQLTSPDVIKRDGWAWPSFIQWAGNTDTADYSSLVHEDERTTR